MFALYTKKKVIIISVLKNKNYSEKITVFCLPIDELKNKQIIHDVNCDCYAERREVKNAHKSKCFDGD
jgi:hypothetical protein